MFQYAGSSHRLTRSGVYPAPTYEHIIEPFAGSARYSLHHCKGRRVHLNDISPTIYRVWRYIQSAPLARVRRLPYFNIGDDLRLVAGLSRAERDLLGFQLSLAFMVPRHRYSGHPAERERVDLLKRKIEEYRPWVKDWTITRQYHLDLDNSEATWFVDPPYQYSPIRYPYDTITDYAALGRWCRSRKGQVIVCEGMGPKGEVPRWLPFRPVGTTMTQAKSTSHEFVWVKDR